MIDGFYVRDPLLGGQASDLPENAIQDLSFITGTFNAEYGEAMSGVVNMVSKEGSNILHGSGRVSSDGFGIKEYDNGTMRGAASLHGPLPFLKNIASFFASFDYLDTKTYLHEATSNVQDIDGNPIQRNHQFTTMDRRERYTANIVINPFRNVKIMLGYTGLDQKQRFYDHLFKEIPDHIGFDYNKSHLYKFAFTHTLNEKTFYALKVAYFDFNYQHKLKDDLDNIIVPILAPDAFGGTSNYEFYGGYWSQDEQGDSIWVISDDNLFRDYTTKEFSILGDVTSQIHKNHLIKLGFEYKQYKIKEDYIPFVNEPEYGETHYEEEPFKASVFAQDKMEFDDFVVNAGLRFDYLDPKSEYSPDMNDPTERVPTDAKYHLSPRIGFGFPVSEKIKMHFAYGQFFQFPDFNFLYSRFNYLDPAGIVNPLIGFIPRFGNPDLQPQTTIAYEFGSNYIFSQNVVGYVTLFYKDIYDYIALRYVRSNPKDYQMFANLDYANSKGIEVGISKRFSSHYSLSINYTYSQATGNADKWVTHEEELVNSSITQQVPPKKTITLEWDQPHRLNFQFDLRWVENWGVNILGTFGSGLPYTPTDSRGKHTGEVNSARKPWTGTVNMRLNKDFHFFGFKQVLYVDVWNLLDKRNVLQVFTSTGKPDESANPNASGEDQHRPHWIGPPRQIEVGMQVVF
jgi:outer membrane receptor protein involved in Fe transport